ncbi:GlxA family transcriptional regulator [Pseudonocardia parietis]|uniref:AraC family transcriptional activator FtrA n=1 Tax=Pseudonocardia parietis TaxID=570936 RepID=A0ABS4VYC0_9PSEU|nr:helix-turn-helix domain-containing protein [Pseudonocardia parietis]MBP2368947.1 AraC family transcriptional activator FtrA [Pseudonocardia parietis]
MSQESSHRIGVLVDDGSNPFELACMTEVLGIDRPEVGGLLYDLRFCAPQPRTTMRQAFFVMTGTAGLELLDDVDTVIVPNRPDTDRPHPPRVLEALRRAHARGARMVGMCSGAFTLAEAGLLDGRSATVHWQWIDRFRAAHPEVDLRPDVLFVDDGDVLTAAGSASALDLALHIVARDHGAQTAAAVARRRVFAAHRPGGQRQFIETPLARSPRSDPLARVLEWASERLDQRLDVATLAAHAGLSRAALHRRFRSELGVTPLAWVVAQRIAHARRLLETTDLPVERIARLAGLGTGTTLRTHLQAATGLGPRDYRRHHATRE